MTADELSDRREDKSSDSSALPQQLWSQKDQVDSEMTSSDANVTLADSDDSENEKKDDSHSDAGNFPRHGSGDMVTKEETFASPCISEEVSDSSSCSFLSPTLREELQLAYRAARPPTEGAALVRSRKTTAGRGGAGRGGPGRVTFSGRGLAATKGQSHSAGKLPQSSHNGLDVPTRQWDAWEKFVLAEQQKGQDGKQKFNRKYRSKSMTLTSSGFRNDSAPNPSQVKSSFTVAFGHSREQSHYQAQVIRSCKRMDLQTGAETSREVLCQRIIDYPDAMNPAERRRKTVLRTENKAWRQSARRHHEPQYRLISRLRSHHRFHNEQIQKQYVNQGALTSYLIWSLRSNLIIVLLSESVAWFAVIFLFTVAIYMGALLRPQCLRTPKGNFEESGSFFLDAFALSWTTFATVGYGLIYPAAQGEPDEGWEAYQCSFMTVISSLESFVGVLFASFCGAVIVGKMTRAKSTANVRFSQRMVVRFGVGVMYTQDDDDRWDVKADKPISEYDKRRSLYPCPVLEFRLANTLYGKPTGEILNARLNVVSSTVAELQKPEHVKNTVMGVSVRPARHVLKRVTSATNFLAALRSHSVGDMDISQNSIASFGNVLKPKSPRGNGRRSAPVSNSEPDVSTSKSRKHNRKTKSSGDLSIHGWKSALRLLRTDSGKFRRETSSASNDRKNDEEKKKRNASVLEKVSEASKTAIEKAVIKKKLTNAMNQSSDHSTSKRKRKMSVVVEDATGGLFPRRLFSPLKLESDAHPFFKRVWTIRHVLNANSPLLSSVAKGLIKESKGRWRRDMCNHAFIRRNVEFQQLIVSVAGTTTGNNVYNLHLYDYRNLHIGYTFSTILHREADGRLIVDLDSIDNIQEQRGGGAEPLNHHEECMAHDAKNPNRGLLQHVENGVAGRSDGGLSNDMNSCLHFSTPSIQEGDEAFFSGMLSGHHAGQDGLSPTSLMRKASF